MNSDEQNRRFKSSMNIPLKWSKIGPLLVTPALLISGCGIVSQQPTPTPIPLPNTASSSASSNSSTFAVERGSISDFVVYSGRVAISEKEDIFFRRSGRVQSVEVEDGDLVQEKDLIAELDTTVLDIDLKSAELAVEIARERVEDAEQTLLFNRTQAEYNLEIAQLALESYQARFETNADQIVSSGYRIEEGLRIQELQAEKAQNSLDRIEDEIDPVIGLNLQRAELNLERVRQSLLDSRIRAPFDGEVRFITLPEDNEQVAATAYAAVARVIKPDSLSVELNLSSSQAESLSEGMPVLIRSSINSDQIIAGTIDSLPRPFGSGIGTLTYVSIDSDADKKRLLEGTTVDVQIQLANKDDVLRIPVAALHGVPGEQYVYVRNASGQQDSLDVEIGIQNDEHVEIVSGLTEGQVVVER